MVLFSYPLIQTSFFTLSIRQNIVQTYMHMQLFSPTVNTACIPQTYAILSSELPTIHTAKCFNEQNLPFSREVRRTEIGHLFEHILLEYIYQLKTTQGKENVVVIGETSWNWLRDPRGTFHIDINIGLEDGTFFPFALKQAIVLIGKILQFDPYYQRENPLFEENGYLQYKQMAFEPSVASE